MSLAADARAAVRERPFLLAALRAGVANYTATARSLDVDGDEEAVATALRRFAEDLPPLETAERDARVTMEGGLGPVAAREGSADPLLAVGGTALGPSAGEGPGGDLTGILATGDVDARSLAWVLDRLLAVDVVVEAAGVGEDVLLVVLPRHDGPTALRVVEDALDGVPEAE